MIFQRNSAKITLENSEPEIIDNTVQESVPDEVETVVGPSVHVEGDFASEGNIIVKGTVSGSVYTSKHLSVEPGAKIMANVRAGSATIAGEIKGNIKIKDRLELLSTSKLVGDIDVKSLSVEAGAIIYGKITMPGVDSAEKTSRSRSGYKKMEEATGMVE